MKGFHLKYSYYRFQVKKKRFFENFAAIVLFGIIGVFISFGIIAGGIYYSSVTDFFGYKEYLNQIKNPYHLSIFHKATALPQDLI